MTERTFDDSEDWKYKVLCHRVLKTNNNSSKIIRDCTGSQYSLNIIGVIESSFLVNVTMRAAVFCYSSQA